VVAITILLSATGIELATQSDVDLDRELQVGGINNLITGLCGGMVGYLSISRTLLNYQAGARNRIAGFIAVGVCCFFLIFGVSFLSYIPKATFGGLLLYLGISLLIEWVYEAWFKLSRLDYILVFAILVIVANFGFLSGVGMGVVIACLLFVFNYSNLRVIKSSLSGHSYQSNFERSFHQKRLLQSKGYELYILLLQGYIFFGTANNLLSHVRNLLINQTPEKIKFMLLDFRLVVGIDSSALVSFIKMRQLAQKLQVKLILTGLTSPIEAKLVQQGVLDLTEEDGPCRAFADLDRGVEWCENQMLSTGTFRRKRFMPFAIQLEEFFPAPDKIRKFLGYMERVRADRDYVVFKQGERSDSIYFVESGQVSIVRESENGQMERMGTVGEGTVLGEIGFYTKSPRSSTVIADKSSRLYRLDQSTLEKIQTEEPLLAAACHQFIAQLLAERVMQATRKTQMLLQ
jgi:SulP family sulfate permease